MRGPYCVYERDNDHRVWTFVVRGGEGDVLCVVECDGAGDHERTKSIAEGLAGVLNAAPADAELEETLKSMRDRGAV